MSAKSWDPLYSTGYISCKPRQAADHSVLLVGQVAHLVKAYTKRQLIIKFYPAVTEQMLPANNTGSLKIPGMLGGEIKDLVTFRLVRLTTRTAELVRALPHTP